MANLRNPIIDILSPKIDKCPFFTVNNTLNRVPVQVAEDNTPLFNGALKSVFQRRDNIKILSCGYIIDNAFRFSNVVSNTAGSNDKIPFIRFTLNYSQSEDSFSVNYPYEYFGTFGTVNIPMENYELNLQTNFNDISGVNNQYFEFNHTMKTVTSPNTNNDFMNVSMLNVPDSLNGEDFLVIPFVKVLHNYNMILRSDVP